MGKILLKIIPPDDIIMQLNQGTKSKKFIQEELCFPFKNILSIIKFMAIKNKNREQIHWHEF